jgi:hypothetical protein
MFSGDDGASWRALKLNLPTVAVHDLVVKDDDLVVGTHGRSIWILDDLTPVREWAAAVEQEAAHLFAPRPAVRWRYHGRISFPPETAGENPPAGAVVNYWLKEKPAGDVTLEILDEQGTLVRRLSSRKEEAETAEDDPDPGWDPKRRRPLPAEAGVQRAVWDLRYDGATKIRGAKLDAGDPGQGPLALPGTYTVKLTAAGQSLTAPLEVRPDPRVGVSRADLEEQLAFALTLRADVSRLAGAVHELRSVRDQLRARIALLRGEERASALVTAAEALAERCDALERQLHNPEAQVAYDILARPGGAKLYSRLAPLYSSSHEGDGRPTQGARDLHAELRSELDRISAEWTRVRDADLPALDQKARELDLGFVVVPQAGKATP